MNNNEKLLSECMELMEFEIVKHADGFGVLDWQGANLGDIESDRFQNAAMLLDRLSGCYLDDYIIDDLYDCAEWGGVKLDNDFHRLLKWAKENPQNDFVKEHKWEFDILDMFLNPPTDINLNNLLIEAA